MMLPAINLPRLDTGPFNFRGKGTLAGRPSKVAPADWQPWLLTLFPQYVTAPFADRHTDLWRWVWAIRPGTRPEPFVAIWPRGGAKSTSAEMATVAIGARGIRPYGWYVRETQDQADSSVTNIADMLESEAVANHYPKLSQREVGKFGNARGWRRNRLRTASNFTVDAIGLDTAARGAKVKEDRPGWMVLDDIDGRHDSLATTEKKLQIITTSLLPAGSSDLAILAIQNLIIPTGIFARLAGVAEESADFLTDRIVSGPHPAVEGLKTKNEVNEETGRIRAVITEGQPTWAGQDLETCQRDMDSWGLMAFLQEAQHELGDRKGALWNRETLRTTRVAVYPALHRIAVAVDPPATTGQCGIIVVGVAWVGGELHGYVLEDCSTEPGASPAEWGLAAVAAYHRWHADVVVGEINNGGEMVKHVVRSVEGGRNIPFEAVHASRGKQTRAQPVSALYDEGRGHHVGYFPELENQMCRWVPGEPSPDRMDAAVWGYTRLILGHSVAVPVQPGNLAKVSAWR